MFALFAVLYGEAEPVPVDEEHIQGWIRAARVGNSRAARELYAHHVARVFRAVRPLCASDADAEDVTQDAFVDALSNLVRYSPREGSRFVSWLLTLALNRARKRHAQGTKVQPTEDKHLTQARDAGAQSPEGARLTKSALLKALSTLPERDRRIVCLRYGAELTAEEVEQVTGVGAANVRKICERQRAALLKLLEDEK
jgi:RNA polymerase sigma-70 factor (ECF subfamily)